MSLIAVTPGASAYWLTQVDLGESCWAWAKEANPVAAKANRAVRRVRRITASLSDWHGQTAPAAKAGACRSVSGPQRPQLSGGYRNNRRLRAARAPESLDQPSSARQSRSSTAAVMRSRWLHHTQGGMPPVICSTGV